MTFAPASSGSFEGELVLESDDPITCPAQLAYSSGARGANGLRGAEFVQRSPKLIAGSLGGSESSAASSVILASPAHRARGTVADVRVRVVGSQMNRGSAGFASGLHKKTYQSLPGVRTNVTKQRSERLGAAFDTH